MSSLFAELKHRNVFKVGVAYAVVAWLLIQLASILFPTFQAPDWVMQVFTVLIILGFPVALVLAWAYELTPEGVKLTSPEAPAENIRQMTGQKLNLIIISLLSFVLIFVVIDNYVLVDEPQTVVTRSIEAVSSDESAEEITAPVEETQSIAVMPFTDLSPNKDQEYFADGITEELLNFLARIPDIQVTGRTSSFYFKDKNEDLQTIGEMLGVGHILEGSVRKDGDQVRITAQLNNTHTGYQLWSKTYDRILDDIFAIQEDIAKSVADSLQVTFGVGEIGSLPGMTRNVAAYDQALLAGAVDPNSAEGMRVIIDHLERAVAIDPEFGLIWLDLSYFYSRAGFIIPGGIQGGREKAEQAFERARELTPDSPIVLHRMVTRSIASGEWLEADRLRQDSITAAAAYSLQSFINGFNASFLHYVGRSKEATDYYERERTSEPLAIGVAVNLTEIYAYTGDLAASLVEADRGMMLEGTQLRLRSNALQTALASGDRIEIDKRLALVLEIEGSDQSITARMGQLLDDPVAAIDELQKLATESENQSIATQLVLSYWSAYFGDPEYALEGLRGIAEVHGTPIVASVSWHPLFREMRRLDGFKDLMRKIGLADYWRTTGNWGDFCRPLGDDDFECT